MSPLSSLEIRDVFDLPLEESPDRVRAFVANVVADLDGLDTALSYLSNADYAAALERMNMWHAQSADRGFNGWAHSYLKEVWRRNRYTLPGTLSVEEANYLKSWQAQLEDMINRSAEAINDHTSAA